MKVQAAVTNLTGGEVSPRLDGRPDVAKQRNGLRICENFQIVVHGGARKRSGTQFVCQLEGVDHILQPFQYSTSDSYMLIFGPNTVWIAKDRGLVTGAAKTITAVTQANPGVVTAATHGFENGDRVIVTGVSGMVELNNRIFTVANKTTNTFELSGVNTSGYGAFTGTASVAKLVTIATAYGADDLQELRFAQYNDVMYITHKDYPLAKISRFSNTSWTISDVSITTGPFRTINGDDTKVMTVAMVSASVTGATNANPCVITTSAAHTFAVGDVVSFDSVGGMTQLNGNAYDVTAVTSTTVTISVNSTAFGTYTSGGTMAGAATVWGTWPVGSKISLTGSWGPFDAAHVGSLWRLSEAGGGTGIPGPYLGANVVIGSGNLIYTSDGNIYGISNLTDTGSGYGTNWQYYNRVPSHTTGVVRVNAVYAGNYFDSNFLHPGYSIVQITSVESATVAYATIVRYQMPESVISAGTSFWEEGAWSDFRGYPRCCAFFEQRLWTGGSDSEPTVLWASKSSAFENFEDGAEDNDAIIYRAASGYADVIRWLSGGRVLVAGTSQGEYAVAASNQNEALTPSNLRMLLQTTYGTSDAPPIRINEAVMYPQRNGDPSNPSRKLREFTYDFTADTFNSVDVTVFAEHVTGSGLTRIAYAMQPDPMIWGVREDGQMPCCTYERLQEVVAWQRHVLGGPDAEAQCVGVCPGPSGDDVWAIVSRTIDGQTAQYLEVFHPAFEPAIHAKADAKFLDASLTYSGASTSTINGLWHLRGEEVSILNNGAVETATVSSSGVLTLSRPTTKACIGFPYTSVLETQELEAGAQAGTAQSRVRRISDLFIRVLGSLGGTAGPNAAIQDDLLYRDADTLMDGTPDLYSGLMRIEFKGEHDREARIRIEHDEPIPFFVTAVVAEMNTNG